MVSCTAVDYRPHVSVMKPKKKSLRNNFGWALYGNAIFQASQWLALVVIAKMLEVSDVGDYALALAICTPITTFASLRLRQVQVTDARDENRFNHLLALQLVTSLIAMLLITGISLALDYSNEMRAIIVVTALGQCVMLIRGLYIGFNQKQERMDTVAKSQTVLSLGTVGSLLVTIWFTESLLLGVIAMQACKLLVMLTIDISTTACLICQYTDEAATDYLRPLFDRRHMMQIVWLGLPLGITGLLLTVNNQVPKYLIVQFLGREELGYFAAILALTLAGMAMTQAAAKAAMPRLSKYFVTDKRKYLRLLLQLIVLGAALGIFGMAIVVLAGRPILLLLFKPDYAEYTDLFVWSMVFGLIAYVVTFIGTGMTSMRLFMIQPLVNFLALAVCVSVGVMLIPEYGLNAAVWALIAGKITQGTIGVIVIGVALTKPPKPSIQS